ncbi:MAG: DUF4123 domain-containing protein [Bacteroidales bacterium]
MSKPITLKPIRKITIEPLRPAVTVQSPKPEEPAQHVADFLFQQAEKEGCQLFGIIDSARNEDVFRHLITGNVRYKSLFEGTMDEQSYGVSGFLVECKKESLLFQWMTTEVWGESCCIFFTSKSDFDNLFKHFQQFNRVYLEDDQVVLFRYYDPRVLRVYLPTCSRREIDLFFGEVLSFFAEADTTDIIQEFRKAPKEEASKNILVGSGKVFTRKDN